MSRLQEELEKRSAQQTPHTKAQLETLQKFEQRVGSLRTLLKNKDFREYLKLEEEMNDPRIVIAHDCTDSTCMALKRKVRDFWNRQKVLQKVMTNGAVSSSQSGKAR